MDFNKNTRIPYKNRIAFKQTRFVVLVAFGLGLLFSLSQIYVDYLNQTNELKNTIFQVVSTMKQPAAEAAFYLDPNLANQVGQGLFEYSPITNVSIVGYIGDNQHIHNLVEMNRPLPTRDNLWLSTLLFGELKTSEIPLYLTDVSAQAVGILTISVDPYEVANTFIERSLNVIVFGIFRTGLFAIIVLFFFYYSVTNPLSHLSKSLSLINPDKPSQARLTLTKKHKFDEFGLLVKIANQYLSAVDQHLIRRKEAEQALQSVNEELEDRVKSRTYLLATEIEERKRIEQSLQENTETMQLLKQIVVIANEAESFKEAVHHTLLTISRTKNWPIAHAYIVTKNDHEILTSTRLWYLEDHERYDGFRHLTESLTFERGEGFPGRVWASKKPIWINDLTIYNGCKRTVMLEKLNILSACTFPIFIRRKVVGVLEFFSPERSKLNTVFLDAMKDIGIQLGRVVEREKAAEKLTTAKEDAEAANKAKSTFLANMSHEIRTPINGAFGLIQILERSNLNNEQKETVNILRDSTVMLTSVIDDILDFSKIEAGQLNIELIPFTLHSVMESVIALLKTKARQKSLDLLLDINPHVPDVLIGDPIRLQQILLNLVNNAIKFTERGYVLVRVTNQQPQKKTVCLLFEVCDTGCGLTMKQQEKLFLPFVQADNSTTRRFGGTGLGLSICKKLVELLDGDIGVKSLPDQGSRFWCTLCFEEANLDAANLIPYEIDAQPPALRLLVVEDNPVNLRVALALLMAEDHNVLSALDGKQALDVLEKNKIDAIFMDVHMPNMDGYEATRRIRTLDNYKAKTPIIMLSADAVTKSKKEYESAGANDFISKPFELSQLNSALVKIFGLRSSSKSESIKLVPTKTKPNQEELSLIDIKALEVLQKSLGHELVDELIGDFSQQSESSIKSFETNLVKKDMLSIVEIAHCLKGSARELKAISVTQLAEEIENAQDIFEVKEKIPLLKIRLTDTLKAYGQLKSHRAIENS